MTVLKGIHVTVALMLAAVSTVANGQAFEYPSGSGHFYQVFAANGITWEAADTAAKGKLHGVLRGQLATINSLDELEFLIGKNLPTGNRTLLWVGGFQVLPCTPPGTQEPWCDFRWLNGETIGESNAEPLTFWAPGQPDNNANAKQVAIGNNLNVIGYYDARPNEVWGYLVEFVDTYPVVDDTLCDTVFNPAGCNLTDRNTPGTINNGLVLQLPPPATYPVGDKITTSVYRVQDSLARCGNGTLTVGPLVIPKGYCARKAPFQLVILETKSLVEIPSDVVNFAGELTKLGLPLAATYGCNTPPLGPGIPVTDQDLALWASHVPTDMLEVHKKATGAPSVAPPAAFKDGNVTDATTGCGSARGKGSTGSWYVFGGALVPKPGANGSQSALMEQIKYRLELVILAFDLAKAGGFISSGDYNKLFTQGTAARGDIDNGNLNEAFQHVENALRFTAETTFLEPQPPPRNWHGEFVYRLESLAWALRKAGATP